MKLKKLYARWKVNLDRSRVYFGYLQFFMIGIVLLRDYKYTIIGEWVFTHQLISMPLLILFTIFLSVLVGWVDKVLGFREAEMTEINKRNVEVMQILQELEEIKKEIKNKDYKLSEKLKSKLS